MNQSIITAIGSTLLATITALPAQTITRISPEIGEPGDVIRIQGTGLQNTEWVSFLANTGGFVGPWTEIAIPTSISATEVVVEVPKFRVSFVGPNGTSPSSPFGFAHIVTTSGQTNQEQFYFLQGTFLDNITPSVATPGTASLQSNGARAVCSFDLSNGEPVAGNPAFTIEVENAIPNSNAFLVFGTPGATPFPPLFGGTFIMNLGLPILVLGAFPTSASGDAGFSYAIPAGAFGVAIAHQWVILDGPAARLSNGFTFLL